MEFKKDIVILLGQCIEDSSVEIRPDGNRVRKITLREAGENKIEGFNQIVKIIDSSNLAVERLYSYEKFIEIFDRQGFSGFVG